MEAIIEKLLLSEDEKILSTPLEELDLSVRVYKSLWRWRVRTVRDVAQIWCNNLQVRNIGERARREILEALQAWCLSLPDFINLDKTENRANSSSGFPGTVPRFAGNQGKCGNPGEQEGVPDCDPRLAVRTPIEALHLPPRTYRALKRNKFNTIQDIYQGWHKIPSIRTVGQKTLDEIHKALHPSEMRPSREIPMEASGPSDRSIQPAKNHIITEGGVVVNADLLQAEEPRKSREERWKNVPQGRVSAKPEDYAPTNTFQAIGKGQEEISSPIRRRKKALDVSGRKYRNLLRVSLETLEKANRPRKVRNTTCPLCRAVMKSIQFEAHLVNTHPQAFQDLQQAVSGSLGWHHEEGVGLVFRDPLHENHIVKCPLCEHTDRYRVLYDHIRDSHPEVDPQLTMGRFSRAHRSKDYENLLRYQAELNQLLKEYEWLKRAQDEPR